MNKHIVFISILTVVLSILGYLLFSSYFSSHPAVTNNTFFLTQPVFSFTGIVEKKNNTHVYIFQNKQASDKDKMYKKKLVYRVVVGKNTKIIRDENLFINNLSIRDIHVGQTIIVESPVDLRTLKEDTFIAKSIMLPPIINTVSGTIIKSDNYKITLQTNPSEYLPQGKKVEIEITPNTTIEQNEQSFTYYDLHPGTFVTVYTNVDISTSHSFAAKRIEPYIFPHSSPTDASESATPFPSTSSASISP